LLKFIYYLNHRRGFRKKYARPPLTPDIKAFFRINSLITAILLLILSPPVHAEDDTIPGAVTAPYPTITNLAVEWLINGDDNLNGVVTLQYRKAGENNWRQGMPLRRIPAGNL